MVYCSLGLKPFLLLLQTYHLKVLDFDDVNLKNDQEAVAAMIMNTQFVVSAPTAVNALAGALGHRLLSTTTSWL